MGHSEETHSLYASDVHLPAKIDLHIFFQTMRISGLWHKLVGWESSLLRDMNHRSTGDRTAVEQTPHCRDRPASLGPDLPSNLIASIAEKVKKILLPEIVRAVVQTRADDLASLLDAVGVGLQAPVSRPLSDATLVSHMLHPSQ